MCIRDRFNADSRYSSIISGIPGALIEDVTLSDIHIYHQGGYTEADGLLTPPCLLYTSRCV